MSNKKNKKLPKQTSKKPAKQPNWHAPEARFLGNIWQFSKGERNAPWPLQEIDNDGNIKLAKKLQELETLNLYDNQRNHHNIKIELLCKAARDEIEKNPRLSDYGLNEVFSIRLTGRKRLVAMPHRIFVDESSYFQLFSFIWFDPNHEVCPSQKKHT